MRTWAFVLSLLLLAESSAGSLGFIDRQERRGERHSVSDQRLETLRALTEKIDRVVNFHLKVNPDLSVEDMFGVVKPMLENADIDVLISTYVFHPSMYARSTEVGMIALGGAGFQLLSERASDESYPLAKDSRIAMRRMKAELEVLATETKNGARGDYFRKLYKMISDLELLDKAAK